ncbi:MAG: YaeQ family protein [Sulfuricurvum sp.]|uniref:YaeQ family protein n=1 Tax=Sulfuricurvum sp. TaxID=2025608 RepID=UPI00262CB9DE|nr:YaeQ family protein [Sulfuricurvum sp.]MDD2829687.1 YaeQ family protein [Sulfuricurvum sp.]MDD4950129.1 YaeQ family protein [Sulfuricurvum sp.]
MAAGSTIYKAQLSIADMDRNYYETHEITIAQHPSETDERLMIRLVAFALNASDRLVITKGIGGDDEPELWEKNYGGEVELWIDLAQVDEKRLRKACGRSERVIVYTYNLKSASAWWKQNGTTFSRFKNLSVIHLTTEGIETLCERTMRIQCNISDSELSFHSDRGDVVITQEVWM